jgi:hypothetical protein
MVRNCRPRKVPGQDQLPRIAQAASFCKHGRVLVSALRAAASMKPRQCHSRLTLEPPRSPSPEAYASLPAVLGRLLHNDPPVGALAHANHHAPMVFLEGNALRSPRRLLAMPHDRPIVAESPSVSNRLVGDTFMPAGKRWPTLGPPWKREMSLEIDLAQRGERNGGAFRAALDFARIDRFLR